jgi:hypothetical protein
MDDRNVVIAALRAMVDAADQLTDGQLDHNNGQSERDFNAAHESARVLLARMAA